MPDREREREEESSKSDVLKGFRSRSPPAQSWNTKDPRLSEESEKSREEVTQKGLVELHQTATMWTQSVLCILSQCLFSKYICIFYEHLSR